MRHWILFSIGFLLLSPSFALAETVLGFCSPDGVTVSSDVTVLFNGMSTGADDQKSDTDTLLVSPDGLTAGTATAAALLLPPGGGGPKDQVDGTMTSFFEFGIPVGSSVAQDTLKLEASGMASTVSAVNSGGITAGAEVNGEARAEFSTSIVAGKDCDTHFNMQAVRPLELYENLIEINVIRDPGGAHDLLATLSPGSPAQTVFLPENNSFLIVLNYDYSLPPGIDPLFGFDYVVTVGESPAVPGLGVEATIVVGLLLLGLGTVLLRVRRAAAQ